MSTMDQKKVVVVVDPYSSGRYLVHELEQRHWPMVGIQSSLELADFWLDQYEPNCFVKNIQHKSLEQTLAALAEYNVVSVMAGAEPGVLLAEDLQTALKLPGNGSETSIWRRDKYDMQERVRECGIRAIQQIYSNDLDEILAWQREWGKWPIIIKPSMSGGTDGVYWCHNETDVKEAFKMECGKLNCNGVVNEKLLAQEFLDGEEYIIDCVSHEGRHVLSGIWVYKKVKDPESKSITYEYARMLESTGEVQDQLIDYTFKVLDALKICEGPSHTEVMMVADGPCLVETGARMHGLKGPKMVEFATGIGTHELAVDVAVGDAQLFNQLHKKEYRYIVKKWVFETMMRNPRHHGTLLKSLDCDEIRNLPSITDIFPTVQPGEELKVTRDLATAPAVLLQVHASLQQCFDDIKKLRELENTTLYQVGELKPVCPESPVVKSKCKSPSVMSPARVRASSVGSNMSLHGLDDDNQDL